jgi:uncharacterized protein YbjQ (UPF0145 family)
MTIKQNAPALKSARLAISAALAVSLAGCVSSHVLVGSPRPPISPDQVGIYLQPPAQSQQIALLQSSSRAAFAIGAQAKTDKVIERLKNEAASLGANGIVLQGLDDQQRAAVAVDSAHVATSGTTATAVGVSSGVFSKSGTAIAIYVPTEITSR